MFAIFRDCVHTRKFDDDDEDDDNDYDTSLKKNPSICFVVGFLSHFLSPSAIIGKVSIFVAMTSVEMQVLTGWLCEAAPSGTVFEYFLNGIVSCKFNSLVEIVFLFREK